MKFRLWVWKQNACLAFLVDNVMLTRVELTFLLFSGSRLKSTKRAMTDFINKTTHHMVYHTIPLMALS